MAKEYLPLTNITRNCSEILTTIAIKVTSCTQKFFILPLHHTEIFSSPTAYINKEKSHASAAGYAALQKEATHY